MAVAAGMVKRFRGEGEESGVTTDKQRQDDQGQSRRARAVSVLGAGRAPRCRGQLETGA